MQKTLKYALILLVQFYCFNSFAQQREIDSLRSVIKNAKNDTLAVRAYFVITNYLFASDPDTVIPLCHNVIKMVDEKIGKANPQEKHSLLMTKAGAYSNIGTVYQQKGQMELCLENYQKGLKIQEELGEQQEIANTLNNIGTIYYKMGETEKVLEYFSKALSIQEKIGSKHGMAFSYNNLGAVYDSQGQIKKALEFYFKGLALQEEVGNKSGMGSSLNNIAGIHLKQGDTEKALEYFNKSLKVREDAGDKRGIAQCLNNIGFIYNSRKQSDKALECYNKSFALYEEIGNKQGIAYSYNNMAGVYFSLGQTDKALEDFNKSFTIYESIQDKKGMATALNNIGAVLLKQSKATKGAEFSNRALQIANTSGYAEIARDAHSVLSKIDSSLGRSVSALDHYKQFVLLRDSISNKETRKAGIKKQMQYEYEKKEAAAKLEQEKKEAIHIAELKRQKQINWLASGALGLMLLSSLLLFNRHRLKQKNKYQEQLNEKQKEQANAVMETQEQERKRIAEDLHDSLGHLLSTAKLNLQTLPEGQKQITNSLQLLNQASEEIRNITFNLMPRTLEEGGLIPALNELATKVTNSGSVKVLLHVHDMDRFVLEKQSQFNIYRIVQEAVNNILKHADAKEISIQVIGQNDHITIMIEDDGKGFDTGTQKNGRGLKNIVTRSLWLKGSLNIDSTPGRGTTITTEFPI